MRTPFLSLCRPMILIAAIGALGGCNYKPGGSQSSLDESTYESTPETPKSVRLVDWTTNTTIWSLDIPVGKDLVVRFYDDHDPKNATRPTLMRWELFDTGKGAGELHNAIPAPDREHRRVEWFKRDTAAAVPAPEAAATVR